MGVHYVRTREEVKTEGDIFIPIREVYKAPRIAACSHIGVRFSTVRLTCDNSVVSVCPRCGETVDGTIQSGADDNNIQFDDIW